MLSFPYSEEQFDAIKLWIILYQTNLSLNSNFSSQRISEESEERRASHSFAIFFILIAGPLAPPGSMRYLMLVPFLAAVASAAGILILYVEDRRRKVWQLLSEIKDSDRAIIISTHYMDCLLYTSDAADE